MLIDLYKNSIKIKHKKNIQIYYDELKIVNYSKYIKEQRLNKLKTLKKRG